MFRKLLNSELNRLSNEQYKDHNKLPIVIILDNIRSQHNIGSAFRTCDAFLVEKLCLCGISATPPSPEIHKSALGAEFSVDWEYFENTMDAVAKYKEQGYSIVSVEQTENSTMLDKFVPMEGEKYALVFGNEVKGVEQRVVDESTICIEIPQYGTKHSLNISVAVGVVLWEITNKYQNTNK